jgi:hypothetical protein
MSRSKCRTVVVHELYGVCVQTCTFFLCDSNGSRPNKLCDACLVERCAIGCKNTHSVSNIIFTTIYPPIFNILALIPSQLGSSRPLRHIIHLHYIISIPKHALNYCVEGIVTKLLVPYPFLTEQ